MVTRDLFCQKLVFSQGLWGRTGVETFSLYGRGYDVVAGCVLEDGVSSGFSYWVWGLVWELWVLSGGCRYLSFGLVSGSVN